MVKKTYTKPSMDEIKVDGLNLMAGSGECTGVVSKKSDCTEDECGLDSIAGGAKKGNLDFDPTTEDFDK